MIKTDNWVHYLIDEDRFIKWYKGWLELANGRADAYLQWRYMEKAGNKDLAQKAYKKWLKMKKLEEDWPEWEDKYEYDWEAMKHGQRNHTK